jgi:hypothetical protein
MADGFVSSLPVPLGIGMPGPDAGRGYGPLPFIVGIPSEEVVGRGYSPLPFIVGIPSEEVVGRGYAPIPFIVGTRRIVPAAAPAARFGGLAADAPTTRMGYDIEIERKIRKRLNLEKRELMEIIQIIASSGILDE